MWRERLDLGKVQDMNMTHADPPHDIDIVRGSAYGIFSRKFVEFILNDDRAKDLLEWSRDTYSPDEHYWATLHHTYSNPHLHTPGGYSGVLFVSCWFCVNLVTLLVPLLTNKDVSLIVRGRLHSSCVRSSMLHGSQTWPVRK